MPPFAKAATHPRARRPRARMLTSAFAAGGCSSGPPRRHRARRPERARRHNPKTLNRASLASCFVATGASRPPAILLTVRLRFSSLSSQTRRRRYFENPQDIKKRKQSTPRKKKGAKPRTAAQALAEKEQAALNPGGRRGSGGFRRGGN